MCFYHISSTENTRYEMLVYILFADHGRASPSAAKTRLLQVAWDERQTQTLATSRAFWAASEQGDYEHHTEPGP